ncbi:metal-dependent hydrolase [Undibacterium sp.]|jgi:inner membrane protein|uniref:metal-dependent hydrolase n=1 Tax=Undibacterium sp. TaxID=1914977 RepID=UPI002D0337EF|nr:metal-dependent hydrolase [Undibacterium sp.]HTD06595.1 metal-dependent hydrolase [Undibacterium sp.]
MATVISHAVIPLTLGIILSRERYSWRLIVAGMLCAMIPDLDVIMFKFGVAYESQFGHRGFTHSLIFAAGVAVVLAGFSKYWRVSVIRVFAFIFVATASHGALDALTTGGLGVEFFWPISQERYFFPEQFIRVSPIGLRNFLTARGWEVVKSELLTIWLPCLAIISSTKIYILLRSKP